MKSIGGFLGMESKLDGNQPYHSTLCLSTGRSCFRFILDNLRPSKVYLPYYICEALPRTLLENKIKYHFYQIDQRMEIVDPPSMSHGRELLVYVNYFGLKSDYVSRLAGHYQKKLIIDDSQAFYQRQYLEVWSFNSARKFFGVADGAYLYSPENIVKPRIYPAAYTYDYLFERLNCNPHLAYKHYQMHESMLSDQLNEISLFSAELLKHIDYEIVANKRRHNFTILHNSLAKVNDLSLSLGDSVPLYYPFLADGLIKENLINQKIYIPTLWPDIFNRVEGLFSWEKKLAVHLAPLPIDQRYGPAEMRHVANEIKKILNK